MTRKEAKELLPIIQAYADGRTILIKHDGNWFESCENTEIYFSESPSDYRIKPETKYRPFETQEECWNEMLKHQPFGSLKSKDDGYFCLIGSVNKDDTITLAIEPNTYYAYHYIFEHYIFSDGTPFGIKVE